MLILFASDVSHQMGEVKLAEKYIKKTIDINKNEDSDKDHGESLQAGGHHRGYGRCA